jgi:hypothetical protein
MKIISSFKDYYDGVSQSLGIDEHIKYIRKKNEIINKLNYNLLNITVYKKFSDTATSDKFYNFTIIGVAGKLYLLLISDINDVRKYIYDHNEIKKEFNDIWNTKYQRNLKSFNDYVALLNNKEILNYFHQHNVGSFILSKKNRYDNWKITPEYLLDLEPTLKDIEFYKALDAFSLYNEMSMFIGQQLNTEIDNSPMTDIEKIKNKGFDDKYGFRTRPKK